MDKDSLHPVGDLWMGDGTFTSNGSTASDTVVFAVRDGKVLAVNSKCH